MSLRNQGGFSLTELLVAILLSLIFSAFVIQIYLGNQISTQQQNSRAGLLENANFLIYSLSRYTQAAGYRSTPDITNAIGFEALDNLFGTANPFVDAQFANGSRGSDTLILRYQGSGDGLGNADGLITDCTGVAIDAGETVTLTFSVTANYQLNCRAQSGARDTTVLLSQNVEVMHVSLGEDTDDDGIPNRFVSPNHPSLDNTQVVAVRLAVLLASEDNRLTEDFGDTWNIGGRSYVQAADRRLRHYFTSTFLLRNTSRNL